MDESLNDFNFSIKKLMLYRYSFLQNYINNEPDVYTGKFFFLYFVKTSDSKNEVLFPDVNEFFQLNNNMMILMKTSDMNNFLTKVFDKGEDWGFYIAGVF